MSGNIRVDRLQAVLEGARQFPHDAYEPLLGDRRGPQQRHAAARRVRRRRTLGLRRALGQEEMRDVFEPSTQGTIATAMAVRVSRVARLVLVHVRHTVPCYVVSCSSTTRIESSPPYELGSTTAFAGSLCQRPSTT